jgi:hypothetical protein
VKRSPRISYFGEKKADGPGLKEKFQPLLGEADQKISQYNIASLDNSQTRLWWPGLKARWVWELGALAPWAAQEDGLVGQKIKARSKVKGWGQA